MSYEFFYAGKPYALDPNSGDFFTGYRDSFSNLGAPTSIQTANQIQEVTNLLNQGGKTFELQPISEGVFDQIPKQHFKEIERLTKLTGTETTVHAPMIDPAGFSKEGWDESGRMEAERQLTSVVERAHELSPGGNIPVTIHASGTPGTEYSKPDKKMVEDYKKQVEQQFLATYNRAPTSEEMNNRLKKLDESQVIFVNQETGQLSGAKREEEYFPESGYVIRTPEEKIKMHNNSDWISSITNLAFYKKEADEVMSKSEPEIQPLLDKIEKKQQITEDDLKQFSPALNNLNKSKLFLGNIESSFRMMYNKAYKYGDKELRGVLDNISQDWQKLAREETEAARNASKDPINEGIRFNSEFILKKSALIDSTLQKLQVMEEGHKAPKIYVKIEDFAKDKTAETLANTALNAYQKFHDSAPIISIENLYPGMAFSKSEELKGLVEATKIKFVEKAISTGKITESQARAAADKLIGVTWDVGHLNILKKGGYTDAEIVKETENISPLVKHVHLTDNFGYGDSHLPPGMGNVPIKQIMETLEKAGFSGKKIIEAGGFAMHFKQTPMPYVLEAFGSPLYAMKSPYWNQMPAMGNYLAMPTAYFPEQHFSIYGSGFSSLPHELGGQVPGKGARFSGAGTE